MDELKYFAISGCLFGQSGPQETAEHNDYRYGRKNYRLTHFHQFSFYRLQYLHEDMTKK